MVNEARGAGLHSRSGGEGAPCPSRHAKPQRVIQRSLVYTINGKANPFDWKGWAAGLLPTGVDNYSHSPALRFEAAIRSVDHLSWHPKRTIFCVELTLHSRSRRCFYNQPRVSKGELEVSTSQSTSECNLLVWIGIERCKFVTTITLFP
jgi:hypothetical protein